MKFSPKEMELRKRMWQKASMRSFTFILHLLY